MRGIGFVLSVSLTLVTSIVVVAPAHAGGNAGAVASLTWSSAGQVTDTACATLNRLFIRVSRSGNLSFRGAEIDLTWEPVGSGTGCMEHIGTVYRTSSGTTCTYLNRGTAVPVVVVDEPNHFHVAWSNNSGMTSCTAGNILEVQFQTDACAPCGGCFALNQVLLLDVVSLLDYPTIGNGVVTLGGGGGHTCQQPTAAEPTTWGHVKSLYGVP